MICIEVDGQSLNLLARVSKVVKLVSQNRVD